MSKYRCSKCAAVVGRDDTWHNIHTNVDTGAHCGGLVYPVPGHQRELSAEDLLTLMRMGEVTRFHTRPTLHPQSVMEHSGRVALLVMRLWPGATVKVLRAALQHDLPESYTGDLPAPVKIKYPALAAATSAIEQEWEELYGLALSMLSPQEAWWLKFCDWLELALYCLRERAMGNHLMVNPFKVIVPLLRDHLSWYPLRDDDGLVPHLAAILDQLNNFWETPDVLGQLYF